MKKIFTVLIATALSSMGISQVLDQSNTSPTGSGWLVNSGGYISSGQSFTCGITGDLNSVVISIDANNPVYPLIAGNFVLNIRNGSGFGGAIVGSEIFTINGTETTGDFTINITSTISLVSGNVYTYEIDETSGTGQLMLSASSDTYAGGVLYNNTGTPTAFSGYDYKFKTYMNGALCPTIDETVNTADFSAICSVDTTIELASSEMGINYFLRDNSNNSIIDGPIAGTGSAITFNASNVSSTTTYNINATSNSSGAVNFDGVNDYIDLGTSSSFDIQGDITVETWVKLDANQPDWVRLIGKGELSTNRTYGLWLNGSGTLMWQHWGTTNVDFYGPTLALNTWYHVAVVRSGNNLEMFLNGVSVATTTYSGVPGLTAEPATIGSAVSMHAYLDGQMDDVRIWNVARTATEIQNNMNVCLTGNETGLVTSLDLNDGSGTTASDLSANGLNGTLTNGATWTTGSPNVYCSSCDLQLTTTPTITINPIADQTVAATSTDLCLTNTGTTITTASSEVGLSYYLRDNANDSLVDGPIAGTGSGLTFNTGVLPNTTTYNVYAKKEGEVLDFDGVDDFISANNLLTISNNFTYEVWVNPTSTIVLNSEATSGITGSTGQKYVVYPQHGSDAYGSTNDAGVGVSVGTNGVSVYEHTGGYLPALLVYPTTITDWTHIAVVCTNKQYTLYINGVLVKTGQTSPKANVHPNIGESVTPQNSGIGGGDYGYFQGSMDDFRLWDYSRTPAEIQSSMINCINGSETGLVAAYDFEDGTGSTIASDKSTNNYNSTLTNMDAATDWMTGLTTCNCTSVMTITPTVTVQDIVAPVADVATLSDVTAECSVTSLTDPSATDNCSATVTVTNDVTLPISTQGTTVVTWTYDDGNGNTSTQTQNVVITDVTAPVADVATLSDVTAECSVTSLTDPSATDNCSATVTVTNDATLPISTQGTTVVTWTYDDGNGNTSTQTQNVVITDVTAPVADVATLSDVTAECSVSSLTDPTATDNCSATVTVTNDATLPISTQGTTVVTWTYDDGNGNTSTQTQNVVITDVTAPVADVATLSDVTGTCEVTSLTDPTATDNCSSTVTVTNDATLPINTVGTTVVTWTYDDGNGNTSTQTQNVVITAPVIDVTTTTVGLTISANNTSATAYQWIDCNNSNAPISGETTASYTATVNGDYAVIVFDGNCSDTSLCVNIADVGINETGELDELVEIYPNPNNGEFYLNTTADNLTLTVYSVDGKIIVNNLKVTQATQLISLGAIESGVYFVKVMDETNQKTIRLVIE